ncbi:MULTISPECIES: response regulator transcription factor [unclassified Kitasatospora]|uniref:response regulator transcription factor n=1 Tax=unclassified Kitasatospora TaxID=2633591 RepID=UPI00070A8359|nr:MULTISPECIES: response regulator transcription factor [unclassified Kitasatospora]KQV15480.1 hypothetical protein ASC99_07805 [Kitasatospora sp. Root107]KRB63933.1 hypothetical protein ASE03_05060 [Kitasatospora sp. Root187]
MNSTLDLACLGIGPDALRVYLHLLDHPRCTDLPGESGLTTGASEQALTVLAGHGLVHPGPDDGPWAVIDPAGAVERLIERRFTQLNDDLRRVAAVRSVLPELCAAFRDGHRDEPPVEIERLEGVAEVRSRLDDLAFFARHEVLALQPSYSPEMIAVARPLDLRCLRRGVGLRTVVSQEAAEHPVTHAYLRELSGLGARIRVSDRAVERLVAYDEEVAVVPVDPRRSARGALVIRQPGLVSSMVRLFEEIWSSAYDLEGPTAAGPLSAADREVLRILCAVDKDEIGARQMGVSLRTFRRYVADLMLRLNAANRFHAAMLAKEAGWI